MDALYALVTMQKTLIRLCTAEFAMLEYTQDATVKTTLRISINCGLVCFVSTEDRLRDLRARMTAMFNA